MPKTQSRKREIRSNATGLTSKPGDGNTLTGYIAMFNSPSEDLGGFREILAPGCFTSSLSKSMPGGIRALVNHNTDNCIGNTASGTLRLNQDDKGLAFEIDLPDTQAARDLKVSVERSDVQGCSFGFCTLDDSWAADEKGNTVRTVKDVELYEVSCGVTFPAYESTSSQLRSLFPDGAPSIPKMSKRDSSAETCQCDCPQCQGGDCGICSDPDCDDASCLCPQSDEENSLRTKAKLTWEDSVRRLRISLEMARQD